MTMLFFSQGLVKRCNTIQSSNNDTDAFNCFIETRLFLFVLYISLHIVDSVLLSPLYTTKSVSVLLFRFDWFN